MEYVYDFILYIRWHISQIEFDNPFVSAMIIFMVVFSVFKRWFLIVLTLMLIVLGMGVKYFFEVKEYSLDLTTKTCMAVYITGGLFIIAIAVYDFFYKRRL